MVKFIDAKVYYLCNDYDTVKYVGSTCQPLMKRLAQHRANGSARVRAHYATIAVPMKIVLIEACPSSCRADIRAREQHWINVLKPELNQVAAMGCKVLDLEPGTYACMCGEIIDVRLREFHESASTIHKLAVRDTDAEAKAAAEDAEWAAEEARMQAISDRRKRINLCRVINRLGRVKPSEAGALSRAAGGWAQGSRAWRA